MNHTMCWVVLCWVVDIYSRHLRGGNLKSRSDSRQACRAFSLLMIYGEKPNPLRVVFGLVVLGSAVLGSIRK